jgi:hypothetical protein
VYPMLPVSLDWPFFIGSNVYLVLYNVLPEPYLITVVVHTFWGDNKLRRFSYSQL